MASVQVDPSGRAVCCQCRSKISCGALRLRAWHQGSGFVHLRCYKPLYTPPVGTIAAYFSYTGHLDAANLDKLDQWVKKENVAQEKSQAQRDAKLAQAHLKRKLEQEEESTEALSPPKKKRKLRSNETEKEEETETEMQIETITETTPKIDSFNLLPEDIFILIFSYFDGGIIAKNSLVCKNFNLLLSGKIFWEHLFTRDFDLKYSFRHLTLSPKEVYGETYQSCCLVCWRKKQFSKGTFQIVFQERMCCSCLEERSITISKSSGLFHFSFLLILSPSSFFLFFLF